MSQTAEQQRLNSLRGLGLLDTPAQEGFDRVTRLAQRIFAVPISLFSLVDADRLWFKSCQGLEVGETSRAFSFCSRAIESDEVMAVADARADARFCDSPLVTGAPHIRFYAGAPIHAPDGARLGTLCVIDRRPRTLAQDGLATLRDLAEVIEHQIAGTELAMTDQLTGIRNRRGFDELGGKVLEVCRRKGLSAAVITVDVDGMKAINDLRASHAEGDRALISVADVLCSTFRDSDVVARLGGDEFCVLLTGAAAADVPGALGRLAVAIAEANRGDPGSPTLSLSAGWADFDPGADDELADLLVRADQAMYADKEVGRPD